MHSGMVLGEKLFEKSGNITGVKVVRVHPIEGAKTEISFTSGIRSKAVEIRKGHLDLQHNTILKTIIGKIQKNLIPL
jgi:hypothetical protein